MVLQMNEQWLQKQYLPVTGKPIYLFACKEETWNACLTLTVNYRKILQKTNDTIQDNIKLAI